MTIAIIGGGAIGSIAAAYLTQAGIKTTLVARQEHCDAINANGLIVHGLGEGKSFPVRAVTKLNKEYDLVIFTTKTQDLERAYQENHEFLEECIVLSSQNGVQADNILSVHFPKERLYSSIVMFGSTYEKPGEVTYNFPGDWIVGKPRMMIDPRAHQIVETLNKGLKTIVTPDIVGMKWLKLFINFNNCIPALINKSMQETFADLDLCRLSIRLLKEGVDIVTKADIELESLPGFPKDRIYGLTQMPEEQAAGIIRQTLTQLSEEPLYGSILQSIKRGKKSEIEFINGEPVFLTKYLDGAAPLNEKMLAMVNEVENTGRFYTVEQVKEEFNLVTQIN